MPTIEGVLERITFLNEETGYTVAKLQVENESALITVVGSLPGINPGETLRFNGDWAIHPEYGREFQIEEVQRIAPATLNGMERYLGSGLIKGIGPITARKIVRTFGLAALDVIRAKPSNLTKVQGIGPKKAERIASAVAAQRDINDIMIFLQGCGVTPSMAAKIYRIYGKDAVRTIKENPYRLAQDIYGVGFKTADVIAGRLGVVSSSPNRVKAGLVYLLDRHSEEGHAFAEEDEFCKLAASELDVPIDLVRETITRLLDERVFYNERDRGGMNCLYSSVMYHTESGIASILQRLVRQSISPVTGDPQLLLDRIVSADGITLATSQRQSILTTLQSGVTILTGGPGTGKTTTVRSLLQLCTVLGLEFLLAAPTGRAAKRLAETTGHEARTVHRLLEFSYEGGKAGFQRNADNPLTADIVVIDEASMLDMHLFYSLLKALTPGTRLVLVGDVDQLPPVGPGNVLRDAIESRMIPVVRLQVVFRQAKESLIIQNAHRINRGEMPILPSGDKDFYFIPCEEPEQVVEQIVELAEKRLPNYLDCDPIEDIQVLSPMRRTVTGVEHLNRLLQERLNPPTPGRAELRFGTSVFAERDKVMQTRNDYQKMVFNGDMGRVRTIDREEGQMHVAFPEAGGERLVVYDRDELDELDISYAISVHKSQGSEYPVVILPLTTQHYMMLQRNLLYTAVSRAKRFVVIIGTRKALGLAVRNNKVADRHTRLTERLRSG